MTPQAALRDFVFDAAERHNIPGAAVGIVHGADEYTVTRGVTSTRDPLRVDDHTLFPIGSISKTFTATAAMSLVEQGLLDLDLPVARYLPTLRLSEHGERASVVVRDLFTHTAGWLGDDVPDTGWGDEAVSRAVTEQLPRLPQLVPPGGPPSYNNMSAAVAAYLLETVTGRSFEEVLRRRVLAPLRLAETFSFPQEIAHRRHAVGHVVVAGSARPVMEWQTSRAMVAGGGLVSSLTDQLAYARYQLDGNTAGTPPVSQATRLAMQRPYVRMNDWFGIGISWLLRSRGELALVTHSGNVAGLYVSLLVLVPGERLGIVALTNAATGALMQEELLAWALRRFLGHDVVALEPAGSTGPLDEYVGRYVTGELDIEVRSTADQLTVNVKYVGVVVDPAVAREIEKPTPVFFVAPDVVAAESAPWQPAGEFVRDPDGSVGWLRWGMRLVRRHGADVGARQQ
ncbi:serine hydrolase domain-containing protein [Dactylosporangium fulvum]|uniref:Beta-lactamase family protein n=1 Tax=Dactylosporangium fulvum TaxID=53359 RepID=A0ABY5W8M4_9ACTN|nr:serine hydrolase domain-containing protein [Dactylosporangium fulvum]UWP85564.1 beta-lactamase family protein [Dactylosporangium fulvum]